MFARIECHPTTKSYDPIITIDDNSSFGDYLHIGAIKGVFIGKFVLGGSNILIIDHSHGSPLRDLKDRTEIPPRFRSLSTKGKIRINDNVWIGDNCVILGGVSIGNGAIVAAGSIVKSDIPPYSIFSN